MMPSSATGMKPGTKLAVLATGKSLSERFQPIVQQSFNMPRPKSPIDDVMKLTGNLRLSPNRTGVFANRIAGSVSAASSTLSSDEDAIYDSIIMPNSNGVFSIVNKNSGATRHKIQLEERVDIYDEMLSPSTSGLNAINTRSTGDGNGNRIVQMKKLGAASMTIKKPITALQKKDEVIINLRAQLRDANMRMISFTQLQDNAGKAILRPAVAEKVLRDPRGTGEGRFIGRVGRPITSKKNTRRHESERHSSSKYKPNFYGEPKTRFSLDDELDTYMKNRKPQSEVEPKLSADDFGKKPTKSLEKRRSMEKPDLDAELEEYMAARPKSKSETKTVASTATGISTFDLDDEEIDMELI